MADLVERTSAEIATSIVDQLWLSTHEKAKARKLIAAALEAEASEGVRRGLERALLDSIVAWHGTNGTEWRRKDNQSSATMTRPEEYVPLRALTPEAPVREAEVGRIRENFRANFEAFATMYNDVNETIGGLPSLEGLLNLGPEMQHACSALAECVRSYAAQKDDVISSALHYVKSKYDPSDDYDFAVYEELRKAAPQNNREG